MRALSIALVTGLAGVLVWQSTHRGQTAAAAATPLTPAQKIADAMKAGPPAISASAAVLDRPATPDGKPQQLRAGKNGWTCYPDDPGTPQDDPMCMDAEWMKWFDQYMAQQPTDVTSVGYAYMLADSTESSNTDPFARKPAPGNEWHKDGPHVMVIYPGTQHYDALTANWKSGGPYVMYKGTPYAHVMWPVK